MRRRHLGWLCLASLSLVLSGCKLIQEEVARAREVGKPVIVGYVPNDDEAWDASDPPPFYLFEDAQSWSELGDEEVFFEGVLRNTRRKAVIVVSSTMVGGKEVDWSASTTTIVTGESRNRNRCTCPLFNRVNDRLFDSYREIICCEVLDLWDEIKDIRRVIVRPRNWGRYPGC